jgi:biopolymer transport protein ExbD
MSSGRHTNSGGTPQSAGRLEVVPGGLARPGAAATPRVGPGADDDAPPISTSRPSSRSVAAVLADQRAKQRRKRKRKVHTRRDADVKPAPARSEINVTPLVDVVLVLLIIFMVVTPMLHRGVDLELPATLHHSKRQDTGEQVVISVRGDGAFVEADRVEVDKLAGVVQQQLKGGPRPVNIRADRNIKFGEVRKVLEQVHAAGAPVVNMETQERKE